MPPFAVPSSLVSTIPVTSTASVNRRACCRPFWPVVASIVSSTSCGAPGMRWAITRWILRSSSIRWPWVCRRPAVSTMTTSRPRDSAAETASKATAAGSPPDCDETKSAPARCAHVSSCSPAAARNVSPAPITHVRPASRRCQAILPIEVVLPVPFTPLTSSTAGWAEMSMRVSAAGVISSVMISCSRALSSSAVVSRPASASASSRSITATVAGTPQSDRSSASSSRSQTASSAGLNMTPASCWAIARRLRKGSRAGARRGRGPARRPRPRGRRPRRC